MTRYALLIGVASYRNLSPLPGVKGDVLALKSVLLKNGYNESNIVVPKLNKPCSDEIESFFNKDYKLEDVCIFYFSGHGDGGKDGSNPHLVMSSTKRDEDIYPDLLLEKIGGCRARLVFILDCCFSGGFVEALLKRNPKFCAAFLASSNDNQLTDAGKKISPYTQYLVRSIEIGLTKTKELQDHIISRSIEPIRIIIPKAKFYSPESNDNQDIPLIDPNQKGKEFNDSFKDRVTEVSELLNPDNNIIIMTAAVGCGKSTLLLKVESIYKKEDKEWQSYIKEKWQDYFNKQWQCYYFDFSKRTETKIEKLVEFKIGIAPPEKRIISCNTCLLFDAVEQLKDDEVEWLDGFLSKCKQGEDFELKIILAGRCSNFLLEDNDSKELKEFNEDSVHDFIKEIWEKDPNRKPFSQLGSKPREWAKNILNLSAGHLKYIEILVNKLVEAHFSIDLTNPTKQKELFINYVEPEINNMLSSLSKNIQRDIELLFIFREFDEPDTLKELGEILKENHVLEIIKKLGFVSEYKDKLGFYSGDKIVRKLLLMRMKFSDPINYSNLNCKARIIYDKWIEEKLSNPFGDPERLGEFFLKESIYHATQCLYNEKFQKDNLGRVINSGCSLNNRSRVPMKSIQIHLSCRSDKAQRVRPTG